MQSQPGRLAKLSQRIVAFAVIVCFLSNTIAYGNLPSEVRVEPLPQIQIPVELGAIESASLAHSADRPFLIHIQDAHGNPSGQRNTEKIIEYLFKNYGITTVFVEGAVEELDSRYLRFLQNPQLNHKLIDKLVDLGEITGSELALNTKGLHAIGIEDAALYRKNFDLFRDVMRHETESKRNLETIRQQLDRKASRELKKDALILLREYLDFDRKNANWSSVTADLSRFTKMYLYRDLADAKEQIEFPNLVRLFQLKAEEGLIDFEKASKEEAEIKQRFGNWMKSHLERGGDEVDGVCNYRHVTERLYQSAAPRGFKFENYPNFTRYARNRIFQYEIESAPLFEEIKRLMELLLAAMVSESFVQEVRNFRLLRGLVSLELTRKEWEELKGGRPIVSPAYSFYAAAEAREDVFMKKIEEKLRQSKNSRAILITGGFHTEGLNKYFNNRQIPHVTIRPNVDGDSSKIYRQSMTRGIKTSGLVLAQLAQGRPALAASLGETVVATRMAIVSAAAASLGEIKKAKTKFEIPTDPKKFLDELNLGGLKQLFEDAREAMTYSESERPLDWEMKPGALLNIETGKKLAVVGDMQGHFYHLTSLLREPGILTGLQDGGLHLVFLGDLIHPSGDLMKQEDAQTQTLATLALFMKLKIGFPRNVHAVLGNHELSHIAGSQVEILRAPPDSKIKQSQTSDFENYIKQHYGYFEEHGPAILIAMSDFFKSWPIVIRARMGDEHVMLVHARPSFRLKSWNQIINLLKDGYFYKENHALYILLFLRKYDANFLATYLSRMKLAALFSGHTPPRDDVAKKFGFWGLKEKRFSIFGANLILDAQERPDFGYVVLDMNRDFPRNNDRSVALELLKDPEGKSSFRIIRTELSKADQLLIVGMAFHELAGWLNPIHTHLGSISKFLPLEGIFSVGKEVQLRKIHQAGSNLVYRFNNDLRKEEIEPNPNTKVDDFFKKIWRILLNLSLMVRFAREAQQDLPKNLLLTTIEMLVLEKIAVIVLLGESLEELMDVIRRSRAAREVNEKFVDVKKIVSITRHLYLNKERINAEAEGKTESSFDIKVSIPDAPLPVRVSKLGMIFVLGNLIRNAKKHHATEVTIEAGHDPNTDKVVLFVGNNGAPINSETIPQLFKKGKSDDKTRPEAGVGLNLSKRLIESYGGDMLLLTSGGQAPIFKIEFPFARVQGSSLGAVGLSGTAVALGGNAFIAESGPLKDIRTDEAQYRNVKEMLRRVLRLYRPGTPLLITHGNGPQVGDLWLEKEKQLKAGEIQQMPRLNELVAETQTEIFRKYILRAYEEIKKDELPNLPEIYLNPTRVIVNPNDEAFHHPDKPIGPYNSEDQKNALMAEKGWQFTYVPGKGWRRVVASPKPLSIFPKDLQDIREALTAGKIVVAVGGGGVPIRYREVDVIEALEGVIDKDRSSALLAKELNLKNLLIVTGVPRVKVQFKKLSEKELVRPSVSELEKYYKEGEFPPGSMGPKVEATLAFVKDGGARRGIITDAEHIEKVFQNGSDAGTVVTAAQSLGANEGEDEQELIKHFIKVGQALIEISPAVVSNATINRIPEVFGALVHSPSFTTQICASEPNKPVNEAVHQQEAVLNQKNFEKAMIRLFGNLSWDAKESFEALLDQMVRLMGKSLNISHPLVSKIVTHFFPVSQASSLGNSEESFSRREFLALIGVAAAFAFAGKMPVQEPKGNYRFAPEFKAEDLIGKKELADAYLRKLLYWEGQFHQPGIAYNAGSGLTYDGHSIDFETGELRGGPRNWSAASKESLQVALAALAVLGEDDRVKLFMSPDNLAKAEARAVDILTKKITSYEKFSRTYPGFGGFLPWFLVSDGGMQPTRDWQDRVPALDNGQLAWSLYAAYHALDAKGHKDLAARYKTRFDMMAQNAVTMFYEGGGKIRGEVKIKNVNAAPSQENYLSNTNFLADPYEGELFTFFITLFGRWKDAKEADKVWANQRPNLKPSDFKTPQGRLTTLKGFWFSSHEMWKYLILPYTDDPTVRQIFENGERARTWNSALNKIPGLFASAHDVVTGNQNPAYLAESGIPELALQPVKNKKVVAPYAVFPVMLAGPSGIALAWLDVMLKGPKMQSRFGTVESASVDGNAIAPLLTWDGKMTTVLAALGGIHAQIAKALKADGKYDAFRQILKREYGSVFPAVAKNDIPFASPTASIPEAMPDFNSSGKSLGSSGARSNPISNKEISELSRSTKNSPADPQAGIPAGGASLGKDFEGDLTDVWRLQSKTHFVKSDKTFMPALWCQDENVITEPSAITRIPVELEKQVRKIFENASGEKKPRKQYAAFQDAVSDFILAEEGSVFLKALTLAAHFPVTPNDIQEIQVFLELRNPEKWSQLRIGENLATVSLQVVLMGGRKIVFTLVTDLKTKPVRNIQPVLTEGDRKTAMVTGTHLVDNQNNLYFLSQPFVLDDGALARYLYAGELNLIKRVVVKGYARSRYFELEAATKRVERARAQLLTRLFWNPFDQNLSEGERVLDIGVGQGRDLVYLEDKTGEVSPLPESLVQKMSVTDYMTGPLKDIQSRYPRIETIAGDWRKIPKPEHTFKRIIGFDALGYMTVAEMDDVFREFSRLMVPASPGTEVMTFVEDVMPYPTRVYSGSAYSEWEKLNVSEKERRLGGFVEEWKKLITDKLGKHGYEVKIEHVTENFVGSHQAIHDRTNNENVFMTQIDGEFGIGLDPSVPAGLVREQLDALVIHIYKGKAAVSGTAAESLNRGAVMTRPEESEPVRKERIRITREMVFELLPNRAPPALKEEIYQAAKSHEGFSFESELEVFIRNTYDQRTKSSSNGLSLGQSDSITPPGKIKLQVIQNKNELPKDVAERLVQVVKTKPDAVLGLATGGTMESVYDEVVEMFRRDSSIDFSRVVTFNLDEYFGLSPEHVQSYRYYMEGHLFARLREIDPARAFKRESTHLFRGKTEDPRIEISEYLAKIREKGGIDWQLLGIGKDGHFAFVEPAREISELTLRDFNEFTVGLDVAEGELGQAISRALELRLRLRSNLGNSSDLVDELAKYRPDADRGDLRAELDILGRRLLDHQNTIFYIRNLTREKAQEILAQIPAHLMKNLILKDEAEFFEPGAKLVHLALPTILDNSRYFTNINLVPVKALTLAGEVRRAREIVLVATGGKKGEAIRDSLAKPVSPAVTSSVFQLHDNTTFIVDPDAATLIPEKVRVQAEAQARAASLGAENSARLHAQNLADQFRGEDGQAGIIVSGKNGKEYILSAEAMTGKKMVTTEAGPKFENDTNTEVIKIYVHEKGQGEELGQFFGNVNFVDGQNIISDFWSVLKKPQDRDQGIGSFVFARMGSALPHRMIILPAIMILKPAIIGALNSGWKIPDAAVLKTLLGRRNAKAGLTEHAIINEGDNFLIVSKKPDPKNPGAIAVPSAMFRPRKESHEPEKLAVTRDMLAELLPAKTPPAVKKEIFDLIRSKENGFSNSGELEQFVRDAYDRTVSGASLGTDLSRIAISGLVGILSPDERTRTDLQMHISG
ncbi:MAG: 6-phosphogluconolactonase, partial [Candidatus Omnitrophica bacterium]|nr:6-phosphogluconolactonase [Candidatus Omnitrophota bacterium]